LRSSEIKTVRLQLILGLGDEGNCVCAHSQLVHVDKVVPWLGNGMYYLRKLTITKVLVTQWSHLHVTQAEVETPMVIQARIQRRWRVKSLIRA
jgi:hypothetical protein